jgi:hypothetical protein
MRKASCKPYLRLVRFPLLPPKGDARWQQCAAKPVTQKLLAEILPRAMSEVAEPLPELREECMASIIAAAID